MRAAWEPQSPENSVKVNLLHSNSPYLPYLWNYVLVFAIDVDISMALSS